MKITLLTLFVASLAAACHTSGSGIIVTRPDGVPPPLPVVNATDLDARACSRLLALRCPEASPTKACLDTFRHYRTNEIEHGSVDGVSSCVAGAVDIPAVRRCGGLNTLTFDC